MTKIDEAAQAVKREWVRPQVRFLEAGAAESQGGLNTDGGGGAQGS